MHIPSARPVLPVTEGPLAGVWAPPSTSLHLALASSQPNSTVLRGLLQTGDSVEVAIAGACCLFALTVKIVKHVYCIPFLLLNKWDRVYYTTYEKV